MKNLFYVGAVLLLVALGWVTYRQHEDARIYREERNRMHSELIKMRNELAATRLQVSKLMQIIETEKKNTQEMLKEAQKRKK